MCISYQLSSSLATEEQEQYVWSVIERLHIHHDYDVTSVWQAFNGS